MDQDRSRKIRLVVALGTALFLATAGLYVTYTAFSGATESKEPSEVLSAPPSEETYKVTGEVVATNEDTDKGRDFQVADVDAGPDAERLRVLYPEGTVPDPFREGREVVITGTYDGDGTLTAEKDSLITKCPSKFSDKVADDTNVEYVD